MYSACPRYDYHLFSITFLQVKHRIEIIISSSDRIGSGAISTHLTRTRAIFVVLKVRVALMNATSQLCASELLTPLVGHSHFLVYQFRPAYVYARNGTSVNLQGRRTCSFQCYWPAWYSLEYSKPFVRLLMLDIFITHCCFPKSSRQLTERSKALRKNLSLAAFESVSFFVYHQIFM